MVRGLGLMRHKGWSARSGSFSLEQTHCGRKGHCHRLQIFQSCALMRVTYCSVCPKCYNLDRMVGNCREMDFNSRNTQATQEKLKWEEPSSQSKDTKWCLGGECWLYRCTWVILAKTRQPVGAVDSIQGAKGWSPWNKAWFGCTHLNTHSSSDKKLIHFFLLVECCMSWGEKKVLCVLRKVLSKPN